MFTVAIEAARSPKFHWSIDQPDWHADDLARIMGGLVPFGPSGLTLYAADLIFLARVKAMREAAKLKVYRG